MNSLQSRNSTGQRPRRFAVAWRNRVEQSIHRVGVLDLVQDGTFFFQYLPAARAGIKGFRPFLGFRSLERVYQSNRLWPFFDLRVMDRKRPDYAQYTRWLGLGPQADRLDILARNGGEQIGDTVLLAEEPHAEAGVTEATVLVRGASYAVRQFGTEAAALTLASGDRLWVRDEPTNPANPRALLLVTADDAAVGWVPDLLIEYVGQIRRHEGLVAVVQNNGTDAPWHTRLLVRFSGRVEDGWSAFSGESWPAVPSPSVYTSSSAL